jgi:putative transposase
MDETYIKIKGQWKHLYRVVVTVGQTLDFLHPAWRDAAEVLYFFCKTIHRHGEPEVVSVDRSGAIMAALTTLNAGKPLPSGSVTT